MGLKYAASFAVRIGESRFAHKKPRLPVGRRGLLGNASRSEPRA